MNSYKITRESQLWWAAINVLSTVQLDQWGVKTPPVVLKIISQCPLVGWGSRSFTIIGLNVGRFSLYGYPHTQYNHLPCNNVKFGLVYTLAGAKPKCHLQLSLSHYFHCLLLRRCLHKHLCQGGERWRDCKNHSWGESALEQSVDHLPQPSPYPVLFIEIFVDTGFHQGIKILTVRVFLSTTSAVGSTNKVCRPDEPTFIHMGWDDCLWFLAN